MATVICTVRCNSMLRSKRTHYIVLVFLPGVFVVYGHHPFKVEPTQT
jgi:hypothetical protein